MFKVPLAALMFLTCCFSASAETPRAFVERVISTLTDKNARSGSTAVELVAAFRSNLDGFVDIGEMARRAIGENWDRLDGPTKDAYLAAYRSFLGRVLFQRLGMMSLRDVVYFGDRPQQDGTDLVDTRLILFDGKEHDVLWHIEPNPTHLIVDLTYDGVLASEAQRREFGVILNANAGDLTALPKGVEHLVP